MDLCLGVTSGMQLKQITRLSGLAERLSLSAVWIGDDIAGSHDVFAVASLILLGVPRLNVGIGITSPVIRNISTIARASAALTGIDNRERFRLGLGIGGLQDLTKLGITVPSPQKALRNATAVLREMWKHKTLSFHEKPFVLRHHQASYASGKEIPIFFGVRGPRMLKLAGQIADGVILSGPKAYLGNAVKLVKASLRNSKQPQREFHFVAWIPTMLSERIDHMENLKKIAALVLIDTPLNVLEMTNISIDKIEKLKQVHQGSGIAEASELVTRDLIDEMTVYGNAEQICDGFSALEKQGFHEVVFGPPYGTDPEKAIVKLSHVWGRSP